MDDAASTWPNGRRKATLTDQQRRAVHTRQVSVLLSSGAGCGKTHVLTERYLSHLGDDGAEVGQVVAITFTERAARQMRGRIRQAVLAHLRSAESEEAAGRWARHLRGLEAAPISTIHSFCGTLLRQFAVEAGLDPQFDVLEEVLSVNIEAEALATSLQKLLTAQSGSGDDLRQLVVLFGWRAVNEAVRHLLGAWDGPAWGRWLETPPEVIVADWQEHARTILLPRYLDYVLAARPKVSRLPPLLRKHPPLPGPMAEAVRVLLDELPLLPRSDDPAAAVERLADAAKVGRQGAKAWLDPAVYEEIKAAFADFRDDIRRLKLERFSADEESLLGSVEVGKRFLRVAAEVELVYRERKRLHGVVDFQDLLVTARDLLRDRPEVRSRLQERSRFVLIDELQDTDPVQMELVELLCGGGMIAGKLFAVGDQNQCLIAGTLIQTATGDHLIEDIRAGDELLAAAGEGRVNRFAVSQVHQRPYAGDVIEVTTSSGRRVCCTPEHVLFTRLIPDLSAYYVYLMRHRGKGHRIGLPRGYRSDRRKLDFVANGLRMRCNQEGGDAIWVLRHCTSRKEAQTYEQLYLAQYGLPGLCFKAGAYTELDQEAIDFVFASLPTGERAERLARDLGLDLNAPHYTPLTTQGWVTVTYLGGKGNSRHCAHRLHFETGDAAVAKALDPFGVRAAKPSKCSPRRWRVETERADYLAAQTFARCLAERANTSVLERYALGGRKSWDCTPAGQVFPGLQVPVVCGGQVIAEEVASVARRPFDGVVYDFTVPKVHNYVAGGIVVHNSIYRFRGADVHLFQRLRQRVAHEGRQGLTTNFRSQPAVLDFANVLVGHRLAEYGPLRAFRGQVNPGPCVEFLWGPCADSDGATEARACEAEGIARRIAAMIGREELVAERTSDGERLRPVRRGDVVLLFRAMSNVHLYEAALRRHGLDYYLVGGRAFFAQQEIYDLLNLLRTLENPQDELSLAGTLRSPFCCLSDEALFVLRRGRRFAGIPADAPLPVKSGLWSGLHDDALLDHLPAGQGDAVLRARRSLDCWGALKDRLPIARLLGEVFADSGYDAATQFEFLGDRKLANLWKLIDLARTFDRSGLFGLAEFIARLGDLVDSQPREEQAATQPENADVVRLMTIHQAKGLEFPVVFVPDVDAAGGGPHLPAAHWDARLGCVVRPPADEPTAPFPDYGWGLWKVGEEIEDWDESLRTLYVACTRAEDYLVLSAAVPPSFRPSGPWMLTLAERFDPFTGACLVPDLSDGEVPRVRVTRELCDVPADAVPAVPRPASVPDVSAPSPIPVRRVGQRVFTVAELEACLRASEGHGDFPVPAAFARHFDAEDGSDRSEWPARRERVEPGPGALPARERLLRSVLENWDFHDPQGWRPALRQVASRLGPDAEGVERSLSRFAASGLFARMSAAKACHRDLEFLLPWPGEKAPPGLRAPPAVRGVIDCVWQDERGGWHLVCLAPHPVPRPGLVFWAHAVKELFGTWPEDATVYSFDDGTTRQWGGNEVRRAALSLADAEEVLRPAHEQPAARYRGGGDDRLAEIVLRQHLERRPRPDDRDLAALAGEIDLAVAGDQRRLVLAAHPLAPGAPPRLCVEAVAPAVVLDVEVEVPYADRRRDVRRPAAHPPQHVAPRQVAGGAVEANRHREVVAARHGEQPAARRHGARDALRLHATHRPQLGPRFGVVALDGVGADRNHLRPTLDRHDQRARPVNARVAGGLPAVGAGGGVDAEQVRPAPVVDLHQEQAAGEDGRGRHSPAVAERAVLLGQRTHPDRPPLEVDADEVTRAEQGKDAAAVGGGRRHRHAAGREVPLRRRRAEEAGPPQQAAVGPVVALQVEPVVEAPRRAGQEDAVAPDHRGADARALERHLPADVLFLTPARREILFGADPIAGRPAPHRPLGRPRRRNHREDQEEKISTIGKDLHDSPVCVGAA